MTENVFKFALIGYPLSHSLSGVIQAAAFNSTGLKGSYEILETKSEDLDKRIEFLKSNGYNGFNVTIPHKIPVCSYLTEIDEVASRLGSVNTVLIREDKTLKGFNTDVYGFTKQLEGIDLEGKKAAILGTGGASRAVVCGLFTLGVKVINLYTRDVENSKGAIQNLREKFPEIEINLLSYSEMKTLEGISVVINTTPLGMKNFKEDVSPLKSDMIETLDNSAVIYDIVYNPIKTELIKNAIKFNKKYKMGLDMLVYQGLRAFEIWTGSTPDADKMRNAALKELV